MVSTLAASPRADVYSRITAEIVAAIENGAGEWCMPWHHDGSSIARPRNIASDKGYRGINILALWVAARRTGYTSGIWGTYQQWAQLGCQVRKGEKATTVVFWKQLRKSDSGDTESDAADRSDDDNSHGRARFFARGYCVFNASQVNGYAPHDMPRLPEAERIARADAFFAALNIPIITDSRSASPRLNNRCRCIGRMRTSHATALGRVRNESDCPFGWPSANQGTPRTSQGWRTFLTNHVDCRDAIAVPSWLGCATWKPSKTN